MHYSSGQAPVALEMPVEIDQEYVYEKQTGVHHDVITLALNIVREAGKISSPPSRVQIDPVYQDLLLNNPSKSDQLKMAYDFIFRYPELSKISVQTSKTQPENKPETGSKIPLVAIGAAAVGLYLMTR